MVGGAECGDAVLFEHRQQIGCVKTVKVIGKDRRFTEPLTVDLAPESFCPAGIGNREVESVRIHIVPVTGGHDVPQRIGLGMQNSSFMN